MKNKLIAILIFVSLQHISTATTRRVLFLGNSYIYTNNLPSLIQQMATAMGDTLIYDQNNIGGYTMQAHSTDATSINKIYSQVWDIVVLQEQSQRPAFDPSQVAVDTYPYARKLDSLIRDHRPCTKTMFFMTWGYKNGDAGNCASYPPICTYLGMQQRLRESYLQMAQDNNGIVSPVGAAWKQLRDSFPGIDLYNPDESHPGINGSYLAASVFYTSIFHKNPINCGYTAGITATDAYNMRRIAAKVVLDSFNKWNQYGNYAYANFNKSISSNTVNFTNTSVNAANYYWNFGDGNTSNNTNPNHTYTTTGKYIVTLTASNTCISESKKDSVTIWGTNTNSLNREDYIRILTSTNNSVSIYNNHSTLQYHLTIYDINGSKIITDVLNPASNNMYTLPSGFYFGKLIDKEGNIIQKKIMVY
jgi:hypothetical protein